MIQHQHIDALATAIDYLGHPRNALGVWLLATGVIAAGYLLTPLVL